MELARAISAGRRALKALEKHGAEIAPRLSAGAEDGLRADLALLTGARVARPAFSKTVRSRTMGERALAREGAELLARLKNSLKACPQVSPAVLKAVGVGKQVNAAVTYSVAESLTAMLEAGANQVEAFRAAGILEDDLAQARAVLEKLQRADEEQLQALDRKKELTSEKNAAQLRVEQAAAAVAAAGQLHFRSQPTKRALFEKILPRRPREKKPDPQAVA